MQFKIITVFFLCMILLVQPSYTCAAKPTHLNRILQRGVLEVALYDKDIPPFFWVDKESGELRGLDVDVAYAVGEEFGLKITFNRTATSFDQMVDMVAAEEVDVVISNLSVTPQRARKVLFTYPYSKMRRGLLVNRVWKASINLPVGMNTVQYMKKGNVRMVAQQGSSYLRWTQEMFAGADILLLGENESLQRKIDTVKNGKAAACLDDELFIKKNILQRPELALKVLPIFFSDKIDSIAIAVPPKSVDLRNRINDFFKERHVSYIDDLIKLYPEFISL
uniref:substrate-binding periplasmic protein n=1 Tax=Candidatus Electrothrix sp. TaxID=2170559 RepID=UPI0040577209